MPEFWPDVIVMQIPLLSQKYHYLCAVQGDNHFKIYYTLANERQARNDVLESLLPIDSNRDVFIDIGGYIGSWTLPMVAVKPKTVYTVEPSKRHMNYIQYQIDINNTISVNKFGECVRLIDKAFGNINMKKLSIDDLCTDVYRDYHDNGILNTADKTIDVITFDSFLSIYGIPAKDIRLIKIDVEGWELAILNGMSKFLSECNPELIIECHPFNDSSVNETRHMEPLVTTYLRAYGYKIKKIWDGIYWYSVY